MTALPTPILTSSPAQRVNAIYLFNIVKACHAGALSSSLRWPNFITWWRWVHDVLEPWKMESIRPKYGFSKSQQLNDFKKRWNKSQILVIFPDPKISTHENFRENAKWNTLIFALHLPTKPMRDQKFSFRDNSATAANSQNLSLISN